MAPSEVAITDAVVAVATGDEVHRFDRVTGTFIDATVVNSEEGFLYLALRPDNGILAATDNGNEHLLFVDGQSYSFPFFVEAPTMYYSPVYDHFIAASDGPDRILFTDLPPVGIEPIPPSGPYILTLTAAPNPSRGAVMLTYRTSGRLTSVLVEVFDVLGRRVWLLEGGLIETGTHAVEWNGKDNRGAAVASGLYLVRVTVGNGTVTTAVTINR